MRRILYLIISVCLLACMPSKKEAPLTLDQALEAASTIPNANDSLFLGFTFGMDSCSVTEKVNRLIQDGKLFNQEGYLKYNFDIDPISYRPAVGFVFTNDTLSKVSLVFFNEQNLTIELIKNSVSYTVARALSERGYKMYEEKNIFDSEDYYLIKNNIIVSIKAYERFVILSYSNAIVDMMEKQKKEAEIRLKSEETLSDI